MLYQSVADPKGQSVLRQVQRDVRGRLELLENYIEVYANPPDKKHRAEEISLEAGRIYTDREDEEIKWYAS